MLGLGRRGDGGSCYCTSRAKARDLHQPVRSANVDGPQPRRQRVARLTLLAVAVDGGGTIAKLAEQATRPSQVSVELGLGVSVEGDIMIAKGAAEANIAITLTYDAHA